MAQASEPGARMVKRAGGALLQAIKVDPGSSRPLASQIANGVRDIILSGGLRAGDRLPATRTLADELGVSRTTMVEVFERLVAEGLVESRTGAGTFVSSALDANRPAGGEDAPAPEAVDRPRASGKSAGRPDPARARLPAFAERLPHTVRAFTTALPALDMFPVAQWSRQTAKHWRGQRDVVLGYGDPTGYPPLRRAIAAHLRATHGIACEDEQIFIVNGAQQAFHLLGTVLLRPGDKVWFENPGAIGARNALAAAGGDLVPLPVDQEGLVVDRGLATAPDFRLAFVTPSHQQPLGVTMSLTRRFQLLAAAEAADAWIVEDDYDGEFHYGGHPLPALKSVDRAERVIYVGTFSKTLFPALRLGYLLAPPPLVDTLAEVFNAYLPGVPSNPQAIVAGFMDEGHFATHLRRMRRAYMERHGVLVDLAREHLAGLLDIVETDTGLHTIGHLRADLPEAEVARRAGDLGVTVAPIHRFCLEPVPLNGLVLGFSGIKPTEIEAGVATLARLLTDMAEEPARTGKRGIA